MKNGAVGKGGYNHPSAIVSLKIFWEKDGDRNREGLKGEGNKKLQLCKLNRTTVSR